MYNFREMRLLERVDFCSKSVGGVGRGDRTTELGNRRSRVDTFRHTVDGDAALRLAGGDNGAMHIHSPHSFASELRQQRWMHVDNPFGKGFQHFLRHHREKSGKHHQVDCRVAHHSNCLLRIVCRAIQHAERLPQVLHRASACRSPAPRGRQSATPLPPHPNFENMRQDSRRWSLFRKQEWRCGVSWLIRISACRQVSCNSGSWR